MARVISLNLNNFQGVVSKQIDFGGVNTTIYGKNGTGKSTVANAIAWLLFDKPADGAKNYTPKTHGADGHLHNLDHAAEMCIETDNGTAMTLKRVYHEVYHKKRSTNTEEFDGHVTDHYIDGVPATEKEYKTRVALVCPPDTAKMLTQPWYFADAMSKDERRRILLDVCGDVTDKDVIEATPEIADLPEILRKPGTSGDMYTVDEYRKIAAARKTEINRELASIPARISEANLAMPEAVECPNIDADIAAKQKEIAEGNERLAEVKTPASNDEADANIRAQIAEIEAQIAEGRAKHTEKTAAAQEGTNKRLNEIHTRISTLNLDAIEMRQEADTKRREADNKRREIERVKTRRAQLLKEHGEVSAQVWDTSKETCPTCKQQLPTGDIEAMRNEFNVNKSNRLAELQAAGKEVSKDVIAGLEVEVASLEAEVTSLDAKVAETEALIKTTRHEIDGIKTPRPAAYEETTEYKVQMEKIHRLRQERNDLKATTQRRVSEAIAAQEAVIRQLSGELERMQQVKAGQEQAKKLTERIEQLEKQEKELTKNYERTEQGLYWCELFVRAKVSMLTNAINRKFTKVKFRLFKEQINGGLTDDCEVLVPGQGGAFVPWGEGANTGAKINGGLEIIKVLSAHYKTSLPIVCDNAEAVSDWTDVTGVQLIKLVVTKDDEKLRVEYE